MSARLVLASLGMGKCGPGRAREHKGGFAGSCPCIVPCIAPAKLVLAAPLFDSFPALQPEKKTSPSRRFWIRGLEVFQGWEAPLLASRIRL